MCIFVLQIWVGDLHRQAVVCKRKCPGAARGPIPNVFAVSTQVCKTWVLHPSLQNVVHRLVDVHLHAHFIVAKSIPNTKVHLLPHSSEPLNS